MMLFELDKIKFGQGLSQWALMSCRMTRISLIYLVNLTSERGFNTNKLHGSGYSQWKFMFLSLRKLNLDRGSTNDP